MKIHFAGTAGSEHYDLLRQEETVNGLLSYFYKGGDRHWEKAWECSIEEKIPVRTIIDSGAFSAYTLGKSIEVNQYAEWALNFRSRWEPKFKSLYFMNLDVIGDQEKSWENQHRLEKLGLPVLPVVTYGAGLKHVDRAIDRYPYIALGGLVGRKEGQTKPWLDACFYRVMQHFKKTNVMPKVHLLGVTKEWMTLRYPCYTSDSSTWVECLRFGKVGGVIKQKKIPKFKQEGGRNAASYVIRGEIKKYKAIEENATKLWAKRGIEWVDQ